MHGLPHNHSKNPRHVHPFPCVGPYRNTCNKSKFFPDILSTSEVFSSRFFSFSPFDQVLLIPIYNTLKSKSNHTFLVLFKSLATQFLFHHPPKPRLNDPPNPFSPYIKYPPHHLISLFPQNPPCQSLYKNLIHRALKNSHWVVPIFFHLKNYLTYFLRHNLLSHQKHTKNKNIVDYFISFF